MSTNTVPAKLRQHISLILLVALYAAISFLFSMNIPLSKAPDEYVHFLYTRFLIDNQRPPINLAEQQLAGYKSDQPPLYHALVGVVTAPIDISEPPRFKFSWKPLSRQLIDIVLPRALLIHTEDETWPLKDVFLAWFVGRWVSILLSSSTVIITYLISLEIFPGQRWLALACAATLAFIPRFIFTGSVLSDDNLIGLLMALFLYLVIRLFKHGRPSLVDFSLIGILTGLALSTKYTVLLVPFEFLLITLWLAKRFGWIWNVVLTRLAVFGVTLAIVASFWYGFLIWNFNQIDEHGLIQGILIPIMAGGNDVQESVEVLGTLSGGNSTSETLLSFSEGNFWEWLRFMFTQFWDVPIYGVPQPYPLNLVLGVALLFSIVAAIGWGIRWYRNEPSQRLWLGVLSLHIAAFLPIPLLRYIFFGRIHDTAQARHLLFPAASALAILLVAGTVAVIAERWQKWAGFFIGMLAFCLTLGHLYYYSVGFPPPLPVRTDPSLAAEPDIPLSVEFTDGLVLRGYDWRLTDAPVLELNLYWYVDALPDVDYRTEITLQDSNNLPQLYWLNHPANGRFPTRAWDVGDSVRDTLKIPLAGVSPGEYEVTLRLLDGEDASLQSSQGATVSLFKFTLDRSYSTNEPLLWQNGQPAEKPVYRYRATIPLTGFHDQVVSLVDSAGQSHLPLERSKNLHLFMVDHTWPSGKYQVQVDGQPAELQLRVENFDWNFTPPELDHPVNVDFNNEIRLLGYDLPVGRVKPGEGIPLVLYWQSLGRIKNNYIIFDRLLDSQQQPWGGYDRIPKETYPTNFWVPGEVVSDGFAVPVDANAPDGIYNIVIGLYDETDPAATSLPLFREGQPLESTSVRIGPIKVGGPPADVVLPSAAPQVPMAVDLGNPPVIRLLGYDWVLESNTLHLTLYWESLAPTPIDWSIFAHIRNQANETIAQKDSMAGSGRYPSSLWDVNEKLADTITIELPSAVPTGEYKLTVGLYDLNTGARLPVAGSIDNSVILHEFTID